MIKVKRISAFADWLRAYKIVLDGEVVGKLKNGKEVILDIPPGAHTMHLQIDWCSSNTVEFEHDGRLINFECGSNFVGRKLFRGVGHIIFPTGYYLWLRQQDDTVT